MFVLTAAEAAVSFFVRRFDGSNVFLVWIMKLGVSLFPERSEGNRRVVVRKNDNGLWMMLYNGLYC